MALKIFVSSVYHELREERQALLDEIQKLQDLFVGMEFFGSNPHKPADYCIQEVKKSDLYVGLFGNDYGSVDEATGISFTQLEYEAAARNHIPCLIFFKSSASEDAGADLRLVALKEKLRRDHIVSSFTDTADLKLRFLRAFIECLRVDLFDKIIPAQRGAIPADVLLTLTKEFIPEQIKSVGQDKYISEVYITREAEKQVTRFTHFEEMFRIRAAKILEHLDSMRERHDLGDEAALAVSRMKLALDDVRSDTLWSVVEELKRAFHFREVEEAIEAVNSLIMETSDGRFNTRANELLLRWHGKPFVNQARLPHAHKELFEVRRQQAIRQQALQTGFWYRDFLQIFPSYKDKNDIHLANDLFKELTRLIELSLKRCLVLVDKAGTGKTNLTCRIAEQLSGEHPVVLLSGQMELTSEYDIEFHIQQRLESAFSGIFSDWMNRVSPSLQDARKWLFIVIDGINENSKRPLFIQLLKGLLPRLEERRIKLILSCRDLFWDVFRDTLEPYLFEDVVPLHQFTETEWYRAVEVYFKRFDVECTLDKEAQEELRNPLLLRFFCEAHKGHRLGRVSNLRLLSVFDLYLKRAGQSISERHASITPDSALNLLLAVAHTMWERRSVSVSPADIGIGPQESSENTSVYNMVLSENIILEETKHAYSTRKSIRFLYDEFMEYIIARSWVDEISESADESAATGQLVQEAVESLGTFPPALGAVLFLDKMLERDGRLVNEFIKRASKIGDFFLNSQQTSLVYAFESINFADADNELIATVEKFEPTVREDLRERLASVILKILEARPDHEYARKYVHKVLEVGEQPKAPSASPETANAQNKEEKVPRLPPGRYHYSEQTRINAISILVQMKGNHEYDVIEEGIRKIGRTDLHSALQALEYLDLAQDEMVYQTMTNYMKISQPEYRIYCAWLLRERYGKTPASSMVQLLTDRETRVHQYAAGLFDRRLVERELLEEMLGQFDSGIELKPWHLSHFIKILAKKASFDPPELVENYGTRIVKTLISLLKHRYASIRLEIYRALNEYPSFINLDSVRKGMQQDSDSYNRSLAEKLPPQV